MGYYTDYKISIEKGEVKNEDEFEFFQFKLEKESGYQFDLSCNVLTLNCNVLTLNGKWYDHEENLKETSEKFPHLTFLVEGEGEENGDIWKATVNNGTFTKVKAKIVFDEVSFGGEEIKKMLTTVMNLGMTVRQDQLNGDNTKKSGQEILDKWLENYLEEREEK